MATQVTTNRDPDYRDLDLDFLKNPKTDALILKTGKDAIKRSIRNLLFTNRYERPFQSYIGSGLRDLLFENFTPLTAIQIKDTVRLTLENFEPRITVQEVIVEDDIDNNGINITISFIIKNTNEPVITAMFLERIR